jgi:hypothetical protein
VVLLASEDGRVHEQGGMRSLPWRRSLVIEVATIASLYLLYRHIRVAVRTQELEALGNAARLVSWEQALGLFTESRLQRLVVGQRAIVHFLDHYYVVMHFTVSAVALVAAYVWRRETTYRQMKFLLITVTIAGLLLHVTFPLAPPRMLESHGFIDTLAEYGPKIYPRDPAASVANQFAAMPSLHFGWALIIAVGWSGAVRRPLAALLWIHAGITLFAIVATGNHYWLDAIVAGLLVVVANAVWQRRARGSSAVPALPA